VSLVNNDHIRALVSEGIAAVFILDEIETDNGEWVFGENGAASRDAAFQSSGGAGPDDGRIDMEAIA
jgi:hypothetical protein